MIDVQVEALVESARRWKGTVQRAAQAAFEAQGVEVAEISLTLVDDAAIRALNRDHLDHDWATDVLAFALYAADEPVLGDVYLGVDQAERQATEEGVPMVEEIARLAVHGTLHVLGFDHPEEAEGRADCEMYRVQEAILGTLDLAGEPA